MKILCKISLLIALICFVPGCSSSEQSVAPSLTFDLKSIDFGNKQSSQIVKVNATRSWMAIPSDPWISVSPETYPGANDHFIANVSISATANDEQKVREGSVIFILDNDDEFTLPISQLAREETPLPPITDDCLMRISFDGSLQVESKYQMTASMHNNTTPEFVNGYIKQAFQGVDNDALIVTPDAEALQALKSLGSFTYTVWIKFAFDHQSVSSLLGLSSPLKEIGNIALNLETGQTAEGPFPFKAFISSESVPWDLWLDFPTIPSGSKDRWTQIGLVYDGNDGRYAIYQDGKNIGQWGTDQPALQFDDVGVFVFGAFPSMVGLSSADPAHWTSTGAFYTGLFDDIYFYTLPYNDEQMLTQYEAQSNF